MSFIRPGRSTPSVGGTVPAWLSGVSVNEFVEITGTSGADGAAVDPWGGLAIAGTVLVSACNGGHTNSSDNRVSSIDLSADAPTWTRRSNPSDAGDIINDAEYYADGKPSSRHVYQHNHYVPGVGANSAGRVLMVGLRASYPSANDFTSVDGFDLTTNTWDASGTWADVPASGGYGCVVDTLNNHIWTTSNRRLVPSTNTWSTPSITGTFSHRWPVAYDSSRHQFFALQWDDGQGFGTDGTVATKLDIATNTATAITLNSISGALAQFESDAPEYAGMDYDVENDEFCFYEGYADTQRVYVIKPTSGSTWDISIKSVTGVTPTAATGTKGSNYVGTNRRWIYVPTLKGFVLLSRASSNLYFLRTA